MGSDEADPPGPGRRILLKTASLGLAGLLSTDIVAATRRARRAARRDPDGDPNGTGDRGPPGDAPANGQAGDQPGPRARANNQASPPSWLETDGERITLALSRQEWERLAVASDVPGIPEDAARVSYAALQTHVELLNQDLRAGDLTIAGTTQTGRPILEPTSDRWPVRVGDGERQRPGARRPASRPRPSHRSRLHVSQ